MKTIAKAILWVTGIILLMQCSNDDEDLYLSQSVLQGTWIEVEPENVIQFVGENHIFTFKQDTFYLKIDSWTDAIYDDGSDTTYNADEDFLNYTYIRGLYFLEADTIHFNGTFFSDSTYSKKASMTYLFGYKVNYKYEMKSNSEFVLNPDYVKDFMGIRLVKQ